MSQAAPGEIGVRLTRAAGLAGLVFATLFVVAFALLRVDSPPTGPVPFAAWWAESRDRITAGTWLVPFAGMSFIWFVAAVRQRIGRGEGLFFATVFIGSAMIFVAMMFATGAAAGATLAAAALENPAQMAVVAAVGHALAHALFFGFAVKMAAMFMLAVASIGRSAERLPRWLVLLTIVLGVTSLVGNTFLEIVALLFPAWVIVVSVLLIRSAQDAEHVGSAVPTG
ncbi:MAG TPA: hypothetical protein VFY23_04255 [Candidatus Limnocylindrales bacterium]|nr:hypothetical protein [Candidatus Limnocylindrales bacterium]